MKKAKIRKISTIALVAGGVFLSSFLKMPLFGQDGVGAKNIAYDYSENARQEFSDVRAMVDTLSKDILKLKEKFCADTSVCASKNIPLPESLLGKLGELDKFELVLDRTVASLKYLEGGQAKIDSLLVDEYINGNRGSTELSISQARINKSHEALLGVLEQIQNSIVYSAQGKATDIKP